MIAADTSTWVAVLSGAEGEDVESLDEALHNRLVMMAPAVLSELLSDRDPKLSTDLEATLRGVPLLDTSDGSWARRPLARHRPGQTPEGPSGRRPYRAELSRSSPAAHHGRP